MARFLWGQIALLIAAMMGTPAFLYACIEKPLILAGSHIARRVLRPSLTSKDREVD
jgi:hypothetical protein